VQFTDLSTGCLTNWNWNFGDGQVSTLRNPSHTYVCGNPCTVTLTVSGPCGSDTEGKIDYISCDCPCWISVTSPDGGETWCSGESRELLWTSQNSGGSVRIEYSTDGGDTWRVAVGSTPDDGEYIWTVPQASSSSCLMRICDAGDQECCRESEGFFHICECGEIALIIPNESSGTRGCRYDQTVQSSGGCPPYTWSLFSGQLPEGIGLDTLTGRIAGTPTVVGSYTYAIQVADMMEHTAMHTSSLQVEEYIQRKADANADCAVDVLDVVAVVNFILAIVEPDSDEIWRADCNGPVGQCHGDGLVNVMDAIKIVNVILAADECP